MIRSTTALLMLGVSMATATTALAQDGCFYGSCNPEASWCRLLCGQTHNNKMFAVSGHRDMLRQRITDACTCTHPAVTRTSIKGLL
jgi:hypothetical protein